LILREKRGAWEERNPSLLERQANAPSEEAVKDRFATAFGGARKARVLDSLFARRRRASVPTMADCALHRVSDRSTVVSRRGRTI